MATVRNQVGATKAGGKGAAILCNAAMVTADERVLALLAVARGFDTEAIARYDEVVEQVSARVAESGSLGKFDVGALTAWKRLRADTPWMAALMGWPDREVRAHTARAVVAAQDPAMSVPVAAAAARSALTPLPGFVRGDALASAVCYVAAPQRLAVYDRRAHLALRRLGLSLDDGPGRYGRYIGLIEQCRVELADCGHLWTARQVDLALYHLGGSTNVQVRRLLPA